MNINSVGKSLNFKADITGNNQNFRGISEYAARKEMYKVTPQVVKIMHKSDKDFLTTLGFVLRRKDSDLKNIFGIKNETKMNRDFTKLKMSSLNGKDFTSNLNNFLIKHDLVNDDGIFEKLPAKLMVFKNSKVLASDFCDFADKVVIDGYPHGSSFCSQIKAKSLFVKNIEVPFTNLLAKTVIVKNSVLGKIVASKYIGGKDILTFGKIISRGNVRLKDSIVEDVIAKGSFAASNVTASGTIKSKNLSSITTGLKICDN